MSVLIGSSGTVATMLAVRCSGRAAAALACAPGRRLFSSRNYKKVTHCLFDLDGLLLDTEIVYKKMMTLLCAKHGGEYTSEVMMKVLGGTEQRLSEIVCRELRLPITPQQFRSELLELGDTMLAGSPLLPGAERLIRHLHASKVPFALATSSSDRSVVTKTQRNPELFKLFHHNARACVAGAERLIRHLHASKVPFALATSSSDRSVVTKTQRYPELFKLFHHKVMGSTDPDVKFGKPHPDIFLVTAARFPDRPAPEKCLVFEDSPHGVTAAITANMQAVMVPETDLDKKLTEHATLVLPSLEHFKPELFGLPPFK